MSYYDYYYEQQTLEKHERFIEEAIQDSTVEKLQKHYASLEIPAEFALAICKKYRQSGIHPFCWMCMLRGENNIPGRFVESQHGYRGCSNVGKIYVNLA